MVNKIDLQIRTDSNRILNQNTINIDIWSRTPDFSILISLETYLYIPLIIFRVNHKFSVIKSIYAAIFLASQERDGEFLINVDFGRALWRILRGLDFSKLFWELAG